MNGLNLATLAVAATTFLHFKGPDGELLFADINGSKEPVGADLYTPGSKEYQKAKTKQNNRFTDRLKKKKSGQSTDERIDEQAEFYADITARLVNVAYEPAAHLTGHAFAKAIYAEPALGFIPPQIDEELGDWENFTKSSATS